MEATRFEDFQNCPTKRACVDTFPPNIATTDARLLPGLTQKLGPISREGRCRLAMASLLMKRFRGF